jgi:ubiquinone/menaquinone biosynthesis C-methylase UbiE
VKLIPSSRVKELLAKFWLIPDSIITYALFKIMYKRMLYADKFGWFQVVSCPYGVDQWSRYSAITGLINKLDQSKSEKLSILDLGGGQGTIRQFVNPNKYDITVLDINEDPLAKIKDQRINIVQGDGCRLPIKDNSFDVVVSVDSLEHIPLTQKNDYCAEMKRVAKRCVIIHVPTDSADELFQGTRYDKSFQKWYNNHFKYDEPNTAEHLSSRLPTTEELRSMFPGATIIGKQNGDLWLRNIKIACTPYVKHIGGLMYKIRFQEYNNTPPYHSCLLFWKKSD